mgnify:CR=1 FL=1
MHISVKGMCTILVSKLLCLRLLSEAEICFCDPLEQKQSSRGREHLVELERSEQLYLVTRDDIE